MNIDGVDRLLEYPEFTNTEKLKSMLGLFSRKDDIIEAFETADNKGVNVYIGSENSIIGEASDSAIVFKTITVGGAPVGAIGIIGPCRMDYQKVISTIGELSDAIANMLENQKALPEGKEHDPESKQN